MEIPSHWQALLSHSAPVDAYSYLSKEIREWASGIDGLLPRRFWIHDDCVSHRAAAAAGVGAFTLRDHIFLGDVPRDRVDCVLRHEIVHLAQVQLALRTGRVAPQLLVEREAEQLSAERVATGIECGADPGSAHPIVWFVAIGMGLYVLLRPGVANAPGPKDKTIANPSGLQILAEAACIFAIPGGAFALGARLGLGFLASSALAGAAGNVSLRAVDDTVRGDASPPLMYLFDATTGAALGFIVPGGIRLIGRVGTWGFDRLATWGLQKSDIAVTQVLAEYAAKAPLTALEAQQILSVRGLAGRVSRWWFDRRGLILLYRGQEKVTEEILSPLARQEGVAASEALVARLRSKGFSDAEIAGYTARWHDQPVPGILAPSGMGGKPLGAVGIPTTRVPGIAANFAADEGIIYVIRVPKSAAIQPQGWQGLAVENEYVILDRVPAGSVVRAIPSSRVAPLMVDEAGMLIPGKMR